MSDAIRNSEIDLIRFSLRRELAFCRPWIETLLRNKKNGVLFCFVTVESLTPNYTMSFALHLNITPASH